MTQMFVCVFSTLDSFYSKMIETYPHFNMWGRKSKFLEKPVFRSGSNS